MRSQTQFCFCLFANFQYLVGKFCWMYFGVLLCRLPMYIHTIVQRTSCCFSFLYVLQNDWLLFMIGIAIEAQSEKLFVSTSVDWIFWKWSAVGRWVFMHGRSVYNASNGAVFSTPCFSIVTVLGWAPMMQKDPVLRGKSLRHAPVVSWGASWLLVATSGGPSSYIYSSGLWVGVLQT